MRLRLLPSKLWLVLALLPLLHSCGIYSFTGASIPPQATTFSVSMFPNHAQLVQPTLSNRFTEALMDRFLRQTNLRLVPSGGDLHFEGSITDYNTAPAAITGDDRAALNRLTITVRVNFINEYVPEQNFERSFSRFWDYPSTRSLSEVEDEAITIISEALVEDIFNQAVVHW
ncbi:MAG TPA: LptE family protein [Bacteroidales bacterium]|nr:LptE family protein [Bacteroidales bacterium]